MKPIDYIKWMFGRPMFGFGNRKNTYMAKMLWFNYVLIGVLAGGHRGNFLQRLAIFTLPAIITYFVMLFAAWVIGLIPALPFGLGFVLISVILASLVILITWLYGLMVHQGEDAFPTIAPYIEGPIWAGFYRLIQIFLEWIKVPASSAWLLASVIILVWLVLGGILQKSLNKTQPMANYDD